MNGNHQSQCADVLESTIRYGLKPHCPELIDDYLKHVNTKLISSYQNCSKFNVAKQCAYLFYDTIADRKNPKHWRMACSNSLDYCIDLMRKFAYSQEECRQLKFMQLRFSTLSCLN